MGVCCATKRCETQLATRDVNASAIDHLAFPRHVRIHIHRKDDQDYVITDEHLQVTLTEPSLAFSKQISLGKRESWVSGEC